LEFKSVEEAVRTGFASAHIYACLRGERKQHKGFKFVYQTTPPAQPAPVQSPVATLLLQSKQNFERNFGSNGYADWIYADLAELMNTTPPAAQRPWVGLTDEEIEAACVPLGAAMLSFTEVAKSSKPN